VADKREPVPSPNGKTALLITGEQDFLTNLAELLYIHSLDIQY
jgi:hypothetical protein